MRTSILLVALSCLLIATVNASTLTLSPVVATPSCPGTVFWPANQTLLDQYQYSQQEYYANSNGGRVYTFNNTGPAPFSLEFLGTTNAVLRVVVLQPINKGDFSGRVTVEYQNPTPAIEIPFTWELVQNEALRSGDVYVWISLKTIPTLFNAYWN